MKVERGSTAMWFAGSSLSVMLLVTAAVLLLLLRNGLAPFWLADIVAFDVRGAAEVTTVLGTIIDEDAQSVIVDSGDASSSNGRYTRVPIAAIASRSTPADAYVATASDGSVRYGRGAATPDGSDVTSYSNRLGSGEKFVVAVRQFARFVSTGPSAGGVLPALIGTVILVLLMSVLVMPIGIAAAIWLSEYAGNRRRARWVRAALTSLAGVPTIVYGVLGLGLFVHALGSSVDQLWFAQRLPAPTFGSGGLLWAALTLALLTLPIVVVSIENGLAGVPRRLRDGALALGATRNEMLWRVLLPAAGPALLTALILAIARAAGAVAPLMLVGVVKLAPSLPIDGEFPYLHPSRQFMHLGFSVYDQALASGDAYDGVARAWSSALLLLLMVGLLNSSAILLRRRLDSRQRSLDLVASA
ncbi:MAG: ABC transporter permease subunit [Dokdonella sp.]